MNHHISQALSEARTADLVRNATVVRFRRLPTDKPSTVAGKRALVLLVLFVGLASVGLVHAATADAARSWYWTESKAETRWKQRYRAVRTVSCIGIDAQAKFINGRSYDRGFYCFGALRSGDQYQITLHARGKRKFIWFPY